MTDVLTETNAEREFSQALAAFQAQVPHIEKAQTAQVKGERANYTYAYADLSDITHQALPLLALHGLSWTCKTMVVDGGFLLISSLKHYAGWTETCEWPLPDPARVAAQQMGSALSYARRYTFTALTGIAPGGEDDDAATAARATVGPNGLPLNKDGSVSKSRTTEQQRVAAGMASDTQTKEHRELVEQTTASEPAEHGLLDDDPWAVQPVQHPDELPAPSDPEPSPEEYAKAWAEYLQDGPENKTKRMVAAFFAKAKLAATNKGILGLTVTDRGGIEMTARALLEQEELRWGES